MNDAFEKIIEERENHRRGGFTVTAMRLDPDTYRDILSDSSFIHPDSVADFDLENEEAVGMVASMEVIPDDSISEPVPDDVELM